jgi:PAS domain S-box-containing protein
MTDRACTVLIIEDNPIDRELYRRFLTTNPDSAYYLLEAELAEEGLSLCRAHAIDAILLDYSLPDEDGLTVIAALQAQSQNNSPPIIMMTGVGDERIAATAIKLGAANYLVKRYLTAELLHLSIQSAIKDARVELTLQKKSQQIAKIWESMTDAYVSLDTNWQIVYTNPAASEIVRQLVDLKPEEFLGKTHWEIFPWSVGNIIEQEYRRAATEQVAVHFEVLYEPTQTYFEIHAYPATEGLGVYFRDITARKQVEAERDRFFNLSLDLLIIANFDGRFLRLNPAWEKTLGFTQAELMSYSYLELVHPDDRERSIVTLQKLTRGESQLDFENRYRCQDGSYRWLSWSATPYPEKNLIYATARDITDRKHYEQERDRFFNLSLDLLAIANFDGYFIRINSSWERVLGLTNTEIMAQPYLNLIHPDDLQSTIDAAQSLSTGDSVVSFENRYRCKDGSYRWLSWSALPDVEKGLIYAIARDTTDRQQIQAALEERNQELDSFAQVVSHDLKAPLRAIANLSQWIEDDLAGSLSEANQQQMLLLRNRVRKMSATIDGLLDYARIGRVADSAESVSISQLLAEVIESIAPPPTFKIEIAANLPTLYAKKILLFQVFSNLIGNSIKHHDRLDGSVSISVREVPDFYEFIITDDGPGIAPQYQDNIFTIFQAVNPQNRADSTGIGLAIVKKIVRAEGSDIRLESQVGKGTTFYLTWPNITRY